MSLLTIGMIKRKKTIGKSRTTGRPALSRKRFSKKSSVWRAALTRAGSFLAPAGYVIALLVLFQILSVRLVLGFYETPMAQTLPRVSIAAQEKAQAARGLPVRLKIPRIRVNALVRAVGLTSDGSMGVPKLPRDAAWYMLGPKPGEQGSAVIAGHVNWMYGATAVFARLHTLKPGDVITVQDNQGISTSFIVRETRVFGPKDDATDVFQSADGKSHLNLITCGGIWDRITKMYSKRLVVFTDKVEE